MSESSDKASREGMHMITPHLVVREADRAADWYQTALGAVEKGRVPVGGGKFMQIELWFRDSIVMLADEFPQADILSPQALGGTPIVLHYCSEDVEALWKQAVAAGAQVLQPLKEQFWGERYGQILDPFGYRWGLAQYVRDVPREEIVRLAAQAFGGQ